MVHCCDAECPSAECYLNALYAECRCAESRYAECRYTECRGPSQGQTFWLILQLLQWRREKGFPELTPDKFMQSLAGNSQTLFQEQAVWPDWAKFRLTNFWSHWEQSTVSTAVAQHCHSAQQCRNLYTDNEETTFERSVVNVMKLFAAVS